MTYFLITSDPNGDESDFDILVDDAGLTCVLQYDIILAKGINLKFDDIKDKV